jgi:hypothetical protein
VYEKAHGSEYLADVDQQFDKEAAKFTLDTKYSKM